MMFPDFDKIRAQAKRDGEAARLLADEGVTPEVNRYYTVSPDFRCGDRSRTNAIWRPVAFSGPNVMVEIRRISQWDRVEHLGLFDVAERYWYPADDLVAAIPTPSHDGERT